MNGEMNVYFQNKRIREHLIKAGLINRHGDILPIPSTENPTRRPRRKSHAQQENKKERRPRRPSADAIRPVTAKSRRSRPDVSTSVKSDGIALLSVIVNDKKKSPTRPKSAHPSPNKSNKHATAHSSTATMSVEHTRCRVVMIYYGLRRRFDGIRCQHRAKPDEIAVLQQHSGGENLVVFKDYLKPNETFSFDSRRQNDYPFALALYINGSINSRISTCCEYRHQRRVPLGGKYGAFGIYAVGKVPQRCRCQDKQQSKRKRLSAKLDPIHYRESVVAPFPPVDRSKPSERRRPRSPKLPAVTNRNLSPVIVRTPTPPNRRSPSPPQTIAIIGREDTKKSLPVVAQSEPPALHAISHVSISSDDNDDEPYPTDFDGTSEEEKLKLAKRDPSPLVTTNTKRTVQRQESISSFKSSTSVTRVSVPISSLSRAEHVDEPRPTLSVRRQLSDSSSEALSTKEASQPIDQPKPSSNIPTTSSTTTIAKQHEEIEQRRSTTWHESLFDDTSSNHKTPRFQNATTSSSEASFWGQGSSQKPNENKSALDAKFKSMFD